MSFAIMLQILLLYIPLLPLGIVLLQRFAVATHNDSLLRITNAAARIAAEIAEVVASLPIGTDAHAFRQALVAKGVKELREQFAQSAKKVGATDERLASILDREVAGRMLTHAPRLIPALALPPETPAR